MQNKRTKLAIITATSLFLGCQSTKTKQANQNLRSEKGIILSYMNSGAQTVALKRLRNMLAKHPKDAELHNLMGLTQLSLENNRRALTHFKLSYKSEPKSLVKLNISSTYIALGDYKNAQITLAQMLKEKPPQAYKMKERLFHNLAYTYELKQNYNQSIKLYKKALEENPAYHMSWLQLGRVYLKQKKMVLAVKALEQSVNFCGLCLEPTKELFMTHLRRGQVLMAKSTINQYLSNNNVSPSNKAKAKKLRRSLTAKK